MEANSRKSAWNDPISKTNWVCAYLNSFKRVKYPRIRFFGGGSIMDGRYAGWKKRKNQKSKKKKQVLSKDEEELEKMILITARLILFFSISDFFFFFQPTYFDWEK